MMLKDYTFCSTQKSCFNYPTTYCVQCALNIRMNNNNHFKLRLIVNCFMRERTANTMRALAHTDGIQNDYVCTKQNGKLQLNQQKLKTNAARSRCFLKNKKQYIFAKGPQRTWKCVKNLSKYIAVISSNNATSSMSVAMKSHSFIQICPIVVQLYSSQRIN